MTEKIQLMKNIAVVIPKFGLVGGAEQFAEELTGRLSENPAYNFQIFANRWEAGGHPFTFHRIPIISFPKFLTTISFARFVHRRLRRADFSLIHTHDRIVAADIYTLHGVPHRYWVNHVRRKRMSLFDHATAWVEKELVYQGGCKKFIAVSKLTKEIFLGQYAVDTKRVEVIHPGVNLSRYENKDKNRIRHDVRQKWQIGNDDFAVIFASMNFEIKGLDHIIHSLAKLRAQGKKVKLIVAGKGNVKKYQKIARKAQMADNIVFTGVLPADQLVNLYLSGDIYMMLSEFDTFGMVVPEAMAAGLPVIISGRVGAKDLVREGENGFVVETPSDHDYLASRVEFLLDEPRRKTMSVAARKMAADNSWEKTTDRYREIYMEILETGK